MSGLHPQNHYICYHHEKNFFRISSGFLHIRQSNIHCQGSIKRYTRYTFKAHVLKHELGASVEALKHC